MTPDASDRGLLRIKPGKVRFPGIHPLILRRIVDEDGRVRHSTEGDPYRTRVAEAAEALDRLTVGLSVGERPALRALREAGCPASREVLRQAIRERRQAYTGAPRPDGAPLPLDRARRLRRQDSAHPGAPGGEEPN